VRDSLRSVWCRRSNICCVGTTTLCIADVCGVTVDRAVKSCRGQVRHCRNERRTTHSYYQDRLRMKQVALSDCSASNRWAYLGRWHLRARQPSWHPSSNRASGAVRSLYMAGWKQHEADCRGHTGGDQNLPPSASCSFQFIAGPSGVSGLFNAL